MMFTKAFLPIGRIAVLSLWIVATTIPGHAQTSNADPASQAIPRIPDVSGTPQPPPIKPSADSGEAIDDSVRSILSEYGTFQDTAGHGTVWIPTKVPADWRPYAVCHWVNSRTLGWYYDDRTPWGAIIHHYGRWTHDATLGWAWVPGTAFSPGWVSWRASPDYVGWAPLPPNGDLAAADKAAFNRGGFWTFMETAVFNRGCIGSSVLPVAQDDALLVQTQPVTALAFAQGIWIVVLPAYVVGPLVDIGVSFKPWPSNYLISLLAKWNVAWNSVDVKTKINVLDCKKKLPPPSRLTQTNPTLRPNSCNNGYLQPDGRCAIPIVIRPPPPSYSPPTCPDGRRPDQGICNPPPVYATIPIPERPPQVVPPAVVMVSPPIIKIEGCRRPGFVRQPDGRCRNPSAPVVVNPAPPLANAPPQTIATVPPDGGRPVLEGCDRFSDAVKRRRCLARSAPPSAPPTYTTAVLPARGGNQPPPEESRPNRPVFAAAVRPRPTVFRPTVFHPTRPSTVRPTAGRPRPATRRPVLRPSRPKPAPHAVFRPARPQFHPRPASRPVFHPAPRPTSPRRGGGQRHR